MSYNNGHSNGYAQSMPNNTMQNVGSFTNNNTVYMDNYKSMPNNNAHLYGNDNSNHFKKHKIIIQVVVKNMRLTQKNQIIILLI